jgi:hypothetical protein
MKFRGDGMTFTGIAPNGNTALNVDGRPAGFELPSLLHIGLSYDFYFAEKTNRLTVVGNFTANSFSRDQTGIGFEYGFREMFMARMDSNMRASCSILSVLQQQAEDLLQVLLQKFPSKKDLHNVSHLTMLMSIPACSKALIPLD